MNRVKTGIARKIGILSLLVGSFFIFGAETKAEQSYCEIFCPEFYGCNAGTQQCECNCPDEVGNCSFAPECR